MVCQRCVCWRSFQEPPRDPKTPWPESPVDDLTGLRIKSRLVGLSSPIDVLPRPPISPPRRIPVVYFRICLGDAQSIRQRDESRLDGRMGRPLHRPNAQASCASWCLLVASWCCSSGFYTASLSFLEAYLFGLAGVALFQGSIFSSCAP